MTNTWKKPPLKEPITTKGDRLPRPWHMWFQFVWSKVGAVITGSGTAGTIPKWSDSDTLTDSIITEASSKISVTTGTDINDFSNDETMADESADALVTEYAVVNYLRSQQIEWDDVAITRNSQGDPTQRLWKRSSATKVTEALTYNTYGHIATQVFTGEMANTRTYSYDTDNFTITGVTKA